MGMVPGMTATALNVSAILRSRKGNVHEQTNSSHILLQAEQEGGAGTHKTMCQNAPACLGAAACCCSRERIFYLSCLGGGMGVGAGADMPAIVQNISFVWRVA